MDQLIEAITTKVLENVLKKITSSVGTQTEVAVRPKQAKTKTVETQTEDIEMEQEPVSNAEKKHSCSVLDWHWVILYVPGQAAVGPGTNGPEEKEKQKEESENIELCLKSKMYIVLTCK